MKKYHHMGDTYSSLCKHVIYMKNDIPVIRKKNQIVKKNEKKNRCNSDFHQYFLQHHLSLKSIFEKIELTPLTSCFSIRCYSAY